MQSIGRHQGYNTMSLDELADIDPTPNTPNAQAIATEFTKRQTEFYERVTKASEATTEATKRYTKYMLWSVVVLAVASVLNLIVSLIN